MVACPEVAGYSPVKIEIVVVFPILCVLWANCGRGSEVLNNKNSRNWWKLFLEIENKNRKRKLQAKKFQGKSRKKAGNIRKKLVQIKKGKVENRRRTSSVRTQETEAFSFFNVEGKWFDCNFEGGTGLWFVDFSQFVKDDGRVWGDFIGSDSFFLKRYIWIGDFFLFVCDWMMSEFLLYLHRYLGNKEIKTCSSVNFH